MRVRGKLPGVFLKNSFFVVSSSRDGQCLTLAFRSERQVGRRALGRRKVGRWASGKKREGREGKEKERKKRKIENEKEETGTARRD